MTESFEPLALHGERVIARRQLGDREVTGGRGRAGVNLARGNVPHLDRRAGNHRARRVGYDPRNGARRALPKCRACRRTTERSPKLQLCSLTNPFCKTKLNGLPRDSSAAQDRRGYPTVPPGSPAKLSGQMKPTPLALRAKVRTGMSRYEGFYAGHRTPSTYRTLSPDVNRLGQEAE